MDEAWGCWMNIYSPECYPRMVNTFTNSVSGDALAGEWATLFESLDFFILLFSWPLWFGLWIIEATFLVLLPEPLLPPATAEGYEGIGRGMELWY